MIKLFNNYSIYFPFVSIILVLISYKLDPIPSAVLLSSWIAFCGFGVIILIRSCKKINDETKRLQEENKELDKIYEAKRRELDSLLN